MESGTRGSQIHVQPLFKAQISCQHICLDNLEVHVVLKVCQERSNNKFVVCMLTRLTCHSCKHQGKQNRQLSDSI